MRERVIAPGQGVFRCGGFGSKICNASSKAIYVLLECVGLFVCSDIFLGLRVVVNLATVMVFYVVNLSELQKSAKKLFSAGLTLYTTRFVHDLRSQIVKS